MIVRSRAPLRLGFAGGGTDVSPYSDQFGGRILNATISLYAYATIIPKIDGKIHFVSQDLEKEVVYDSQETLPLDGTLDLLKGVYNRMVDEFNLGALSFELQTFVDAPAGSGLGTSSTLVVAIIGAFARWQNIPLGEYDVARLAYEIERKDLAMSGGKQDQYAATFGGINFMEFYADDKVIVNPLRIQKEHILELESNLVLFYTGSSRLSSKIIDVQIANTNKKVVKSLEAMHRLKQQATDMKNALLTGKLDTIGECLGEGWAFKKQMAEGISNPFIDEIYDRAMNAGCTGGKVSGAGGGGFMFFYCPNNTKRDVIKALGGLDGQVKQFNFVKEGLVTWNI
ncbi:dehydrogenase [Marinilongibacter aquaticus]|uniref:GHMP family kinase ATP-binding protein n=1 Tax=Marinilongibacter aquaticus TaxID=2975157 RepID=UPI0021BD363E|nr:dehydrogenase [Marinilongibacter aquaticus]UBM57912.1 dehydrogenase [Marinilongibacter aquaticus]